MRKTNKLLFILLTISVVALTFAVCVVPASAVGVGDIIQFGNYLQTKVSETAALRNAANAATWKSYDYYIGNAVLNWGAYDGGYDGNMRASDFMQFADFFLDDVRYRAVKFTQYRPWDTSYPSNAGTSSQDENHYSLNTTYFFKYEPLEWRVLDPHTGLVLCEKIIDSQAYQNVVRKEGDDYYIGSSSTYANNYAKSSIRTWLNDDFYNGAFNNAQKAKIKSTTINNDAYSTNYSQYNSPSTTDRIFLLSYSEAQDSDYDLSSDYARKARGTDYAKCQGLYNNDYANVYYSWWLRSAGGSSKFAGVVDFDGELDRYNVNNTFFGVRPVCRLSNLESDISQPVAYTVTVTSDPANGGTVTGGGRFVDGEEVTLTAKPNSGNYFIGWYEGSTKVKATENYTFTVTKDVSLTAKFVKTDNMIQLKKPTDQLNNGDWYFDADATHAAIAQSMGASVDDLFAFTDGSFYKAIAKYDPVSGVLILQDAASDDPNDSSVFCPGDLGYEEYTAGVKQYHAPSQPESVCPWCGGQHEGFFQSIIGWFHNIFANLFGARY